MSPAAGAQLLGRRMLRRWVRGIVPVVGIGYASWDAQRTVREISRHAGLTLESSDRGVPSDTRAASDHSRSRP